LREEIHARLERRMEKLIEILSKSVEGLEIHHIEVNENTASEIEQ